MNFVDLHPTICNICGGEVIFTSNADIYGKEYGSGKCYLCTKCGAYVGTHKPYPQKALGLLADKRMRNGKMACHDMFDTLWRGRRHSHNKRQRAYENLATLLGIPIKSCHFGYFDIDMLQKAYKAVKRLKQLDDKEKAASVKATK